MNSTDLLITLCIVGANILALGWIPFGLMARYFKRGTGYYNLNGRKRKEMAGFENKFTFLPFLLMILVDLSWFGYIILASRNY